MDAARDSQRLARRGERYLWFAFNKGDSADPGLGKGIMIDDVAIVRGCGPASRTVWDHDTCGGGTYQAGEACNGGEESANAYLGRVGRVLSFDEDGRSVGERRFVYKGMNGRLSGARQLFDWKGYASSGVDSGWASFVSRTGWSADGQVATLTAPYRAPTEARGYSYQRRRGSLVGITDTSRGQSFLQSLSGHAPVGYDATSQPTWIGLANGTSMAIPRDALHRPVSMTVSAPVASGTLAPWQSGTYAFDGAGDITAIGSQRFTYDAAFRLVGARVLPQAQAPAVTTPDQLSWVYDLAGNMLSQTLVSTTQVPEPPGHDFVHGYPSELADNQNRFTDTGVSYDPNGNLVRFKGQQQQPVGALWDANNRMQAFVEGDPWTSAGVPGEWYRYDAAGQRWFRMGRDGKVVLTLRDEGGQALSEFVETPTSGGPVLKADFVYGLGKLLVERKVGVAPPEMAANSPLTNGTNERFLVTAGAGAGSYTVDIAAPSGYRNRVAGVTLDAQGRFTLPESALSPLESNAVRIRKDGQVGSGYSAPVSLAYDPTVTATSPNPVRALSIHWASNNLVVRWSLAQDTGKAQRLFFRSSDGLTTVLLTPTALPSSVLSYTLASQALSAPCGALYLETVDAAASPMAGLPSAAAGEQGIGVNPCPGGAPDPPDPPAGPAFVNWYHHRDHLGTLRNVTDEAGYVVVGYDDYPYGARMPQGATPSVGGSTRQYTGHERDAATGLDYMMARYYGAGVASFLSADSGVSETQDPRSWNGFAYTRGTPVRLVDPTGNETFEEGEFSRRLKVDPLFAIAYEAWKAVDTGKNQRLVQDTNTTYYFGIDLAWSGNPITNELELSNNGQTAFGRMPDAAAYVPLNAPQPLDLPEISITISPPEVVLDSLTPTGLDPFFIIVAYAMALKEESDTAESAGSGKFSTSEFYKKEKEENDRKRPEAQKYVQDVETWLEDHGFSPVPVP